MGTIDTISPDMGMTVRELLEQLFSVMTSVDTINLVQFKSNPSFTQRIGKKPLSFKSKIQTSADGIWQNLWLPEYHAVFACHFNDAGMPNIVRAATYHDDPHRHVMRRTVRRDKFNRETLDQIYAEKPDHTLAVSSRVGLTSGEICHIPMMDFECPTAKEYLDRVVEGLRSIGEMEGAILESGRSYHYYGFKLLPEKEWYSFLGRCLLLAPMVDVRYIGHRLIDAECVLRICPDAMKPDEPKVVRVLNV